MKKITASLIAALALSSTAAYADTPVVREMNSFSHVLTVAKGRTQAAPSEFVIYHQDAAHPCPPKGKHDGKHHHHHGEHAKKEGKHHMKHSKNAKKDAAKAETAPKKADEATSGK